MKINKRIWKTGVMAVGITLIANMFVMRLDDWSKGLNSEFIVYGQTNPGGGTGGSGTTTTTTEVVPQVAIGSLDNGGTVYTTTIQIVNTGPATVSVSGSFFNTNGTTSTATISKVLDGATSTFTGTLAPTSVAADRSLVLTAASTGAYVGNWASITSTGNVAIVTTFELRAANGALISRVGTETSPLDMKQFVIPRNVNTQRGVDVGFAIVNTGTTAASAIAVLKDASGATLATRTLDLPAKNHVANFASQFFPGLTDGPGNNFQFISFTSTSPNFAAMALGIEAGILSGVPIERLQ